jgi:hypothetical protein
MLRRDRLPIRQVAHRFDTCANQTGRNIGRIFCLTPAPSLRHKGKKRSHLLTYPNPAVRAVIASR